MDDNDLTSKGVVHIASAFHGSEDGHSIENIQLNYTMCGAIGARALIDAYGPDGKDLPNLMNICQIFAACRPVCCSMFAQCLYFIFAALICASMLRFP